MHIVILGNGIAGITAARHVRKLSDHRITVISAETDHHFSRTALMYVYMGHMRYADIKPYEDWFWEKNRIELKRARVARADFDGKQLHFAEGEKITYDKLILACGSTPNKFGWPGQDLKNVGGLYSYQDLEAMEAGSEKLERAVVVGGGLIGIEMAEMFHSRHIPVTLLVREKSYWNGVLPPEESAMINRHIRHHGIDLRLEDELQEIQDDGSGEARRVLTKRGERIDCGYVGLTAGVRPNVAFLKDSGLDIDRGILVDEHLQTNIPDVYAIGDNMQLRNPPPGRRAIEAVWYVGRISGETVAHNVCGQTVPYAPGMWFNSAKFIDIEYQIYGEAPAKMPDHLTSLYWEHPDGEKAVRLVYTNDDQRIIKGFHLMGVRYRHEVCERWIVQQTPVEDLLPDLKLANFDPEFYDTYEDDIIALYNRKHGTQLRAKRTRNLKAVLRFLKEKVAL